MEFDEQRSLHGLLSASDLKREKTAPMLDSSGSEMSEFHMFPASTKYLVWNEFCERFLYYGMKTILALFLFEGQRLTEVQSTEIVHLFMVLCYAIPVLGAIISDSVLGHGAGWISKTWRLLRRDLSSKLKNASHFTGK